MLNGIIKRVMPAAALVLLLSVPVKSHALYYEIDSGSVLANTTDPGLVVHTSVLPIGGISFNLNDGGSFTFGFFNLWTDETWVNPGEDTVPKPISATLAFSVPTGTSGTVSGETVGIYSDLFGFYQAGQVTWNGPVTVSTADREFSIALSDATFNEGILWTGPGQCGTTIEATIKQISSRSTGETPSVPDGGSTAILLGSALSLFGVLGRRFRK